jgi:hypothetical protein
VFEPQEEQADLQIYRYFLRYRCREEKEKARATLEYIAERNPSVLASFPFLNSIQQAFSSLQHFRELAYDSQ